VLEHYNTILKAACQLKHASECAMVTTHCWGYQGPKRMHELLCLHLEFWGLKIKKEMQDDHEITPVINNELYSAYQPTDIKDHAIKWHATMTDACDKIAASSVALMQKTGKQSHAIKHFLKCLYLYKQIWKRFIKREEHCQWMEHDIHVWDDREHDIMECYQKKIDKVLKKSWGRK